MNKGKNKIYGIERKILCIVMVLLMAIGFLEPSSLLAFTYDGEHPFNEKFEEVLSKDKTSSTIKLNLPLNDQRSIESITLPDENKIEKDAFQEKEDQYYFEYIATENKQYDYVVEYREYEEVEPEVGIGLPVEVDPVEPKLGDIKKETLSYQVSDIKTKDQMELHIQANDLSFRHGDEIKLKKDITIKDEDNNNISDTLNIEILNDGGYTKGAAGNFDLSYVVKHPISQKEYTFSRKMTIEEPTKEKEPIKEEVKNEKEVLNTNSGFNIATTGWTENGKTYNITVSTAMAKLSSGNVIRINLPQYVKLVTIPSANVDVEKVEVKGGSDEPTGTNIFIYIKDSATLGGVYDGGLTINIDQNDFIVDNGVYNGKYEIDFLYTNDQGINISAKQAFTFKNRITAITQETKHMQRFGEDILNTTVPIYFNADMSLVDFEKVGNYEMTLPEGFTWLGDASYYTETNRKLSIPITKDMVNEPNGNIANAIVNVPLSFNLKFSDANPKKVYPSFMKENISGAGIRVLSFTIENIRYGGVQYGEGIIKNIEDATNKNGTVMTPKVNIFLCDYLNSGLSLDNFSKIATADFDKTLINGKVKVIYEIGSDYIWNGNKSIQVDGIDILYDKDSHTVEANIPSNKLIEFQSKNKIATIENIELPLYMDKDKLEKDLFEKGTKEQAITVKSVEMTYDKHDILSDNTTLYKDIKYKTTIYEPRVSVLFSYPGVLNKGTKNSELFKLNITTPSNMSTVDPIEISSQNIPEELHITKLELIDNKNLINGTKLFYTTNKTESEREHVFDENIRTFQTNGEYITSYRIVLPEISKDKKSMGADIKFFGDVSSDNLTEDKVNVEMELDINEDSFGRFIKGYSEKYINTKTPFKKATITLNIEISKGTVEAKLVENENKLDLKQGQVYDNMFNLNLKFVKNNTQIISGIKLKKDKNLKDAIEVNKITINPDLFTYVQDVKIIYSTNKKNNQEFIPSSINAVLNLDEDEFLYEYTIEIGEVITQMPLMKDAVQFGGKTRNKDFEDTKLGLVHYEYTSARMNIKAEIGNTGYQDIFVNSFSLYREDSVKVEKIDVRDSTGKYVEGDSLLVTSEIKTTGTKYSIPIDLKTDFILPSKLKVTSVSIQRTSEITYKECQLIYKTNLNEEEQTGLLVNNRFDLPEGEYFTSASLVMKETTHGRLSTNGYFLLYIGIKNDKYDRDGKLIDKVIEDTHGYSIDNHDGTKVEDEGKIIYNRDTPLIVNLKVEDYKIVGDKKEFYPEDIFTVTQSATLEIRSPNKNPLTQRQRTIESPIYYIPIGNDFDYVENSLVVTNFIDKKPRTKIVVDGENKFLKIEFYGDETSETGLKALDKLKVDFQFDVRVNRFAVEAKSVKVMTPLGVSLVKTMENMDSGETTDQSYIEPGYNGSVLTVKGEKVYFYTRINDVYSYINASVLQYAGITSIHAVKPEYSEEFKDDIDLVSEDTINYQFAVTNRTGNIAKSYYAYIPVPKKGDKVEYVEDNVIKSFTQEWDTTLKALPTYTSTNNGSIMIDYSTSDQAPTTGVNDPSNAYVRNVKFEDVRMIRVKVTNMGPKFNMKIKGSFKAKSEKEVTGKLQNIISVKYIYNYGDETTSEKFSGQLKPQKWNLHDYEVEGYAWEDLNKDGIFKAEEKVSGVELEIKESDTGKTVANLTTGADGSYRYALSNLNKQYSVHLDTKKDWYLTEKGKGDPTVSSHFDVDTKIAEITNQNYKNLNAGLIPLAKIEVIPNPIQVKEREKSEVIQIALSNMSEGEKASLKVSIEDEEIASYDDTLNVVRGIKEGETNLIARITTTDGKVIEEKVEIDVTKDKLPTAQYDDIVMFANSELKAKEGIVILDGKGNELDINDSNIIQIDSSDVKVKTPGKYSIRYTVELKGIETEFIRNVYVHGNVIITPPADNVVKIGTNVDPVLGARASYQHIESNGDIMETEVPVTSTLTDFVTSDVPSVINIPLSAIIEVVPGVSSIANASYDVIFNGLPEIHADKDNYIVRVGATFEEMKTKIDATASVQYGDKNKPTDLTKSIDYSELKEIDTSVEKAVYPIKLYVSDKDGAIAEKEITINISDKGSITVPDVNIVVGTTFDPKENVTVIDGLGNTVDIDDVKITGKVNTDKIDNYTMTYDYTDDLGNEIKTTNTIHVHGDIQFIGNKRVDLIEENITYFPHTIQAYYKDSNGIERNVVGAYNQNIDQSNVQKHEVLYTVNHPVNSMDKSKTQNIYVHGKLKITPVKDKTVKVNTKINPTLGSKATYRHVKDDGSFDDKDVKVTSTLPNPTTSNVPVVINIPLAASVEVVSGLQNSAVSSYHVTFNGLPEIKVSSNNLSVRVDATPEEIKAILKATASVQLGNETGQTDLTSRIDFSELYAIDTSKVNTTKTFKLSVSDGDGATAEKEITVHISNKIMINLPTVDLVEDPNQSGSKFDPKAGVNITDGLGKPVNLDDVKITNSVEITRRGNYEVTYEYQDSLNNKMKATNTIRVHGDLVFEGFEDANLIESGVKYVPNTIKASYLDSDGDRVVVRGTYEQEVNQNVVGKYDVTYTAIHPVNSKEHTQNQTVYVHGRVKITPPENQTVKVNTDINPLLGAYASYEHVELNGDVTEKEVPITSTLNNPTTSVVPMVMNIPLSANVEVVPGLSSSARSSYDVTFNGLPEIVVVRSNITVKVGTTLEEMKELISASASVLYGNDTSRTDLSADLDFSELEAVDTSVNKAEYTIKLYVSDRDGGMAEKEITIKMVDTGSINLPDVNLVVGMEFDPKENVTVINGEGNPVDINDVSIQSGVNMNKHGEYKVTYEYRDVHGFLIQAINIVKVSEKLEFDYLNRVDLFEKDSTYIPYTGKASYIDSKGKNQVVAGVYHQNIDQNKVGKSIMEFEATHPINGAVEKKHQAIYVHGKIAFDDRNRKTTYKVGTSVDPSDSVIASYRHVNDDGSTNMKELDVYAPEGNITKTTPSYKDAKVGAKVEIHGAKNSATETMRIGFNGYADIKAIAFIQFEEGTMTTQELINRFQASASMKKADQSSVDLTDKIDYSDVNQINFNTSGNYQVNLSVIDEDGVTSYEAVTVEITSKPRPLPPVIPGLPEVPTNPIPPTIPTQPTPELPKDKPVVTEEDSITIITKDIPKSSTDDGITDDLLKSFIDVYIDKSEVDYEIVSHNVLPKVGTYHVVIRLADGRVRTVKVRVVDETDKDVQKPGFGREEDCLIQLLLLLLLLGYSAYVITISMKKQNESKNIEETLKQIEK